MELDFDDALSEDWLSQPRSSTASSVQEGSSLRRSVTSNTSLSRIPRPQAQHRTSISSAQQNQALQEKSASDLNRPNVVQSVRTRSSLQQPRTKSVPALSGSLSTKAHGTVQYKEEARNGNIHDQQTPEWKRRLLGGKGTSAKHQDLFSPMGLEHVFRPPTVKSQKLQSRQVLKRNKSISPQSEQFPSSPPLSVAQVRSLHSRASSDPPLSSLLEVDDRASADNSISQGVNDTIEAEDSTPTTAHKIDAQHESTQAVPHGQTKGRVQSGRSDGRHESFSPAQIDDAEVFDRSPRSSANQLATKLHMLGIEGQTRPCSRSSDSRLDYRWIVSSKEDAANENTDADNTSVSLPKNPSIDSRAFAANGGFITTKRGGYSSDSFFRQRPLSPSSYQKDSTPAQKNSETRENFLDEPELPAPQTPTKPTGDVQQSPSRLRSSGSPLKLFDNYDTFTHDRLARRISQFERDSEHTALQHDDKGPSHSPPPEKPPRKQDLGKVDSRSKRLSSFGLGDLDDYSFTHCHSSRGQSLSTSKDQDNDRDPLELPCLSNEKHASPNTQPHKEETPNNAYKLVTSYDRLMQFRELKRTRETKITEESHWTQNEGGKRFLNSPEKMPHAKRRRTITEDQAPLNPQAEGKPQVSRTSSVAGKKRKDARYENSSQQADPDTIATRHMLRPKTPHANQTRSLSLSNLAIGLSDETEEEHVSLDVNAATGILAGELAHMALDVAKDMTNGERKASVTTADFFKEANMIMQHIRAQARPRSGRTSSGLLNSDQLPDIEESRLDDLTKEEFSRPASREGQPQKSPVPKVMDARIASHLRRFEDSDGLGIALNSSVKSLPIPKESNAIEPALPQEDGSYIRILERPTKTFADEQDKQDKQQASVSSNAGRLLSSRSRGSESSTSKSIPTGSSRGSTNRAVIPPEKVSHLIGENMGRMTFDHGKQCWVKRKTSKSTNDNDSNKLGSEATEEDPLMGIPDLDVDEREEMRHFRAPVGSSRPTSGSTAPTIPHRETQEDGSGQDRNNVQAIPRALVQDSESSAISRYTRFASSGARIETRATSWGDELPQIKELIGDGMVTQGRVSQNQAMRSSVGSLKKQQARAFTVTFSSPLINPQKRKSSNTWSHRNRAVSDSTDNLSDLEQRDSEHSQLASDAKPLSSQWMNRKFSSATQIHSGRPVSRIDEDDELSFLSPGARQPPSMELTITTTPQALRSMSEFPPPMAGTSSIGFHLSPLPDFTVHQVDESLNLDVDYVAKRRGLLSVQEVEGKFSLAIKDLVQKITDVEPYEPYWEYIRRLDLHDRGLLTLHMLDEFCSRIEELDVSNNELGQLNGAPGSLRVLSARQNCLSGLTAWGHLHNLQYLDVSGNQIESLKGFSNLVHLRELRAENNEIEDLQGIMGLNGLLRLKVGRNRIKKLDVEGSDLYVVLS